VTRDIYHNLEYLNIVCINKYVNQSFKSSKVLIVKESKFIMLLSDQCY